MKRKRTLQMRTVVISFSILAALLAHHWTGSCQEILRQFNAPGPEARGLAWDGQYLWCADSYNGKVYQLDPNDGSIISSFNFSIDYSYGGLAWSPDNTIWITSYSGGSTFYKVNPATGAVISSFHCPGG